MPTERLPMRKVREVLRLKHACGASERLIAQSLGIGRTTVGEYLRRAAVVGVTWPVELDDAELERLLFTPAGFYDGADAAATGLERQVHAELRRRGVTLMLLWEEYRAEHPDGYGYSRFCDLYGAWRKRRRRRPCGRPMWPARSCSSTTPATRSPVIDAADRRGAARPSVRRSARRIELHLRRGALERGTGRLDRLACQRARLPRRRAELMVRDNLKAGITTACSLRAGRQPDLPGHGGTLRHRRSCRHGRAARATRRRSRTRVQIVDALHPRASCATDSSSRWRN